MALTPIEALRLAKHAQTRARAQLPRVIREIEEELLKAPIDPESVTEIESPQLEPATLNPTGLSWEPEEGGLQYRSVEPILGWKSKHTAEFQHPHTKEIYPMTGHTFFDDAGKPRSIEVMIHNKDGKEIGKSHFSPWWESEGTEYPIQGEEWTGSPNIPARIADRLTGGRWRLPMPLYPSQKRDGEDADLDIDSADPHAREPFNPEAPEASSVGMGSAMYDLAATIAQIHGVRIVPSGVRNWLSHNMWRKHEKQGYWPPLSDDKKQ